MERLGETRPPTPPAPAAAIVPPPPPTAPVTPLDRVAETPPAAAPRPASVPPAVAPPPSPVVPASVTPQMANPATATSGATTLPLRGVNGPIQVAIIQFGAGSASLGADDLAVLRDVARMYARSGGTIRIYAHSSHDGGSAGAQDQDVSYRRGAQVMNTLQRLGVPARAVSMEAMADGRPAYDTSTARGIAANRRAEIFLDF
jgi:outer membrane protein OmpA-like peptidoglycan-associated protein